MKVECLALVYCASAMAILISFSKVNFKRKHAVAIYPQRLSFIPSFLFGNLRREALIEAPSPREKKASGQDR